MGPFPINALDARRLLQGLERLEREGPARAAALRERSRRSARSLLADVEGDPDRRVLLQDEERFEAILRRHAHAPCPALDPVLGTCDLYEHRPVACRTFGLPVRIGAETLPPCRLCFADADDATVEACRVEPDPDDLEGTLLEELDQDAEGATLIALVLGSG